jgi:hypothetical protein
VPEKTPLRKRGPTREVKKTERQRGLLVGKYNHTNKSQYGHFGREQQLAKDGLCGVGEYKRMRQHTAGKAVSTRSELRGYRALLAT